MYESFTQSYSENKTVDSSTSKVNHNRFTDKEGNMLDQKEICGDRPQSKTCNVMLSSKNERAAVETCLHGARLRKTRRGKKRRILKDMPTSVILTTMAEDELKYNTSSTVMYSKKFVNRFCKMAPENSTQFIMEDHMLSTDRLSNLWLDGASDDDWFQGDASKHSLEDSKDDSLSMKLSPAYTDIDFQYVSPDDMDMNSFMEQDFEFAYDSMRGDDLMSKSKPELVQGVLHLEKMLSEIGSLTSEMELLRRENEDLLAENRRLKSLQVPEDNETNTL